LLNFLWAERRFVARPFIFLAITGLANPMRLFLDLLHNPAGASAAEYALILAIVGSGIAVAAIGLGFAIDGSINHAGNSIANCGGGC